jgi:hypothetical protein
MIQGLRTTLWITLALSVSACCAAQDKAVLLYKAKTGQVVRDKSEGTLSLEAGGRKATLEVTEIVKTTVGDVSASGDVTLEQETESTELTFNGQKAPPRDDSNKDKVTIQIHPDGSLISYKSADSEADKSKMGARLYGALNPVFTDKAVGTGDKWSHEFKADADMGLHAAKGDYEILGFEKLNGADTVKVKISYQESDSSPPLGVNGTIWIEKTSGDVVAADYDIENVAFGGEKGPMASGHFHAARIEGSILGGGKPGDTKPGSKPGTTETKPTPPKEKTIDETIKDYEKLPGVFTLYRKREAGRDTIYMEIKEDQLDKLMMMEVTASTGTGDLIVAGTPLNDIVFKFSRSGDDKILFVTPNIGFRADGQKPIARAVQRSFPDAYLDSYKIEAKQPERKSLLINVSDLFRGDISQISTALGSLSFSLDREKTYVASIKNFPENLVVETAYHFSSSGRNSFFSETLADPRSMPLKISYTLFPLSDNGYRPRLADPRVGYFTTDYQDFSVDSRDDEVTHYIIRWQMEKADPKAALSPPKKPIVFWLDNAIPLEYRDAVREGILYWNKAFLKLGIKDAIVVKQMPDNADWDDGDMRYNTIRWVASPSSGYAVSLFRVNPITGQILNANITVDANLVHYTKLERTHVVDPVSYFADTPPDPNALDSRRCDMAAGAMEQAWFGQMALDLLSPPGTKVDELAYTQEFIRHVVSHEMGHCLGLRHNFVASTYHTPDELKDPKIVAETGVSASVMEYNPFNIFAIKTKGVDYWSQTIGPYDIWAIQYGYTPIDAKTSEGEIYKLSAIASRDNEPGHAYETDGDADQFDPAVTRWDMGRDPLAYWQRTIQVSRYLLLHLPEREPKQGESYWQFTEDYERLLGMYSRGAAIASRYIGGQHLNRNHRGDPGEHPTLLPVPAADQKRALNILTTYIFAANSFLLPTRYYGNLTSEPFGGSQEFPVRDQIASVQRAALLRVFSPVVLRRIVNNEFKVGDPDKALTLPTLYHTMSAAVWSELPEGKNISSLRRQLQRAYLNTMIEMVINPSNGAPDDAKMLAWDQLRQLKTRIAAAQRSRHDEYTRIHLDESLMQITRALDAHQVIGGASSPQIISLQALLGGSAPPTGK